MSRGATLADLATPARRIVDEDHEIPALEQRALSNTAVPRYHGSRG
jgi:hypothetical protein